MESIGRSRGSWSPRWPTGEVLGEVAYVRGSRQGRSARPEHRPLATAAPVVEAVGQAVDGGLVDQDTLHRVDATWAASSAPRSTSTALPVSTPPCSTGTTLPLVDRTARALHAAVPSITSLRPRRTPAGPRAAQHLVALVNLTLEQLDTLPGAAMVRRRMERLNAIEGADPGDV